MTDEMKGIRCKSYTLLGADGNHLTLSETLERDAIIVSIQQNDDKGRVATVRINGEQFAALCGMNSLYDGLEVRKPEPEAEADEAIGAAHQEPL